MTGRRICTFGIITVFVLAMLTACGKKEEQVSVDNTATAEVKQQTENVSTPEVFKEEAADNAADAADAAVSDTAADTASDTVSDTVSNTGSEENASGDSEKDKLPELFKKFQAAADDTGIYAVVVTLSDKAADEGSVEFIYYGPKGTGDENVIVNTFHTDYFKEAAGTFDITTYYDGQINTHQSGKTEVKINNTFGATVRGGNVIISYAPKGEELKEVYRAEAEEFMPSGN